MAQPGHLGGSKMSIPTELYACIYAREFPAQALLRLRPGLHARACVVIEGSAPLERVCALNSRARRIGLEHGMSRVEIDAFPAAEVLPRSLQAEAATRNVLLECAGSFSPRVEERWEDSALLCVIDLAGTEALFGAPGKVAQRMLQSIRAIGLHAQVTVSANFHAAICVARGLPPGSLVQVVARGQEAAALRSLPLAVLDLTEIQAETFRLWGIATLGMLAALPGKELTARVGQDGNQLQAMARGERAHLFEPLEPPLTLEEHVPLDSPLEQRESLLFGINVMLEQLLVRAAARMLALAAVTLRLGLEGGGTHIRTVRPALPSIDKTLWLKLLQLELEAHPPPAAVVAVSLGAEPGSLSKVQLELFSPQLPEAARLDVTLARIRALVGDDNAGCAVLDDTHAADGFHVKPFTVPAGRTRGAAPAAAGMCLRQLRPPEQVSLHFNGQQPGEFFFRRRRYVVERAYGPWTASGAWWSEASWKSEQWDLVARAQDGSLLCCLVLRGRARNHWQMRALYD